MMLKASCKPIICVEPWRVLLSAQERVSLEKKLIHYREDSLDSSPKGIDTYLISDTMAGREHIC